MRSLLVCAQVCQSVFDNSNSQLLGAAAVANVIVLLFLFRRCVSSCCCCCCRRGYDGGGEDGEPDAPYIGPAIDRSITSDDDFRRRGEENANVAVAVRLGG